MAKLQPPDAWHLIPRLTPVSDHSDDRKLASAFHPLLAFPDDDGARKKLSVGYRPTCSHSGPEMRTSKAVSLLPFALETGGRQLPDPA